MAEPPRIRIDQLVLRGVPPHRRAAVIAGVEQAARAAAAGIGPAPRPAATLTSTTLTSAIETAVRGALAPRGGGDGTS